MSGKKRITVDEDAWNEAMRKANQLRQVQRDLPGMLAAVKQASEEQAARDRAELEARQNELSGKLAALSSYAKQIEATTTQRLTTATATIMNEAKRANANLRAETRQLIERQEQRFTAAMETERAERQRDFAALQQEIARARAAKEDVLETARTVVSDARVLRDAIDSTLPHGRYAPGELAKLTSRLAIAEANVEAGRGEAALATAQELVLRLGELRSEVELRDAEWRAAHLTAVTVVTALIEQIGGSEHIDMVDDESGMSADLDVDFWSEGELSKIKAQAGKLLARLADKSDPPSLAELSEVSERTVTSLDQSLSEVLALAQTRQWASQVRVNVAEHVVEVLENTTGYDLADEPIFAGGDQRKAFYSKLRSGDDSEIVIEVAPDASGKSCLIRVLSYESGAANEHLRVARVHAIADALGAEGLPGTPSAEPGEPDPAYRDFARLRQRPAASAVPGRA